MSGTATAPPLNAQGGDPMIQPPTPPPVDASNHPDDRARGVKSEASPEDVAAIERARRGTPDVPAAAAEVNPRADEPPAEGDPEPPATDAKPDPKQDATPPWMKAEITKERNARRAAEELAKTAKDAADAAQKRLDEALALAESLRPKPPPEPIAEPRPQRDQFSSPDAYDAAIDQWASRNADARAATARTEAEAALRADAETKAREADERRHADYVATTEAAWKTRRDAFAAQTPDFADIAESDAVQISESMGFAIKTADNGPAVAYHLGKNPEEAARIRSLPLGAQLFEMGRLAATLAIPPRRDVSRAPAPISPLAGTNETPGDREESMAEVAARVAKRESNGRHSVIGARH